MSTTVDSRVAELRFDNAHFEKNVATSMSTLDKLKEKLNLTGASKGLQDVNKAVNSIDFSKAEATATRAGFHVQDVWMKVATTFEDQIARKITNAASNMFNQLVKAAPGDGFKEYEMTLNAVQTTMAGTGKTAEEVEKELKKLDEYADKTVYSTSDMLNNLPKFTNAGVDLEKATKAMIGIANATAHAGGDAGKASIAFYNLGQAIGTGYLTRMDYNSINNAGIATMRWKEAMVEAAIAQGTLTKVGEDAYQAGNKTLTLQQLFIDGLQEQWATTDVMMKVFGDYGDETTEIGKAAYSAAQDVKTFTMMMDSLKATAGTGWKETWQIIFGGLDDAKEFWTGLSNFISGIITKIDDLRNYILGSALGRGFTGIGDKLKGIFDPLKNAASDAISTIENLDQIARRVIRGDYKNTDTGRRELLMADGYNWALVQNRVNEMKECSVRWSVEEAEAELRAYQIKHGLRDANEDLNESYATTIDQLAKMSDAELEAAGYTEEQIKALRELEKVAKKLGLPLDELIAKIDKIDGRWLLINSFKTMGQTIIKIFKSIGAAWNDAFGITKDQAANKLFDMIAALHRFSQRMKMSDETADKLTRTLKGVFAILDLLLMVVGGPIKIAFKIIDKLLGMFNLDILSVTAAIGDVIVKFRNWVEDNNIVMDCLYKMINIIKNVVLAIWELPIVQKIFNKIKDAVVKTSETLSNGFGYWLDLVDKLVEGVRDGSITVGGALSAFGNAVKDAFMGTKVGQEISKWIKAFLELPLVQKVLGGIKKSIKNTTKTLADGFKYWLNLIKDLAVGVANGSISFGEALAKFGTAVKKAFLNIPLVKTLGKWLKAFWELPAVQKIVSKLTETLDKFKKKLSDVFGKSFDNLKNVLSDAKNIGRDLIAGIKEGLKNGTMSIGEALISLGKFIINTFKNILGIHSPSTVFMAIGGFIIAGLLGGLIGNFDGVLQFFTNMGTNISNIISSIPWGSLFVAGISTGALTLLFKLTNVFGKFLGGLGDMFGGVAELLGGVGKVLSKSARSINKVIKATAKVVKATANVMNSFALGIKAHALKTIAIAIAILVGALVLLTFVDTTKLWSAVGAIFVLGVVLGGLTVVLGKFGPKEGVEFGKISLAIVGMAGAILLLGIALKTIGSMKPEQMSQAIEGLIIAVGSLIVLMAVFAGLSALSKFGVDMSKIGTTLLAMAGSFVIMAIALKIIGKIPAKQLEQAMITLACIMGVMAILGMVVGVMNRISKGMSSDSLGGTLIKMAGAVILIAIACKLLAGIPEENMWTAIKILGAIGLIVLVFGAVSALAGGKLVGDIGDTLLKIAGAIAILALIAVILGKVKTRTFDKGFEAILKLSALVAGLIVVVRLVGKDAAGIGKTLISIAGAIGILAAIAVLLGFVDPKIMWKGIGAVTALTVLAGALMICSKFTGQSTMGSLIAITVMIGLLAAAMIALAHLKIGKALGSAAAIAIVLGVLAVVFKSLSSVNVPVGTMVALAVCLGLLAAALTVMSFLPIQQTLGAAAALSLLLLTLTGVMAIMNKMSYSLPNFISGVLGLVALCIPLVALAGILCMMSGVENAIANATALSLLVAVLSIAMLPLALVGTLIATAILGIGGLLLMCIPLVAVAGILCMMKNVENAMTNAKALILLITTLTDVAVKLAIVAPLALLGVAALTALTGLIVGIGALAVGIGALVEQFPILQSFIDTGLPILVQLAGGLGEMMGAFIGGIAEGICNALPPIGLALSQFMTNASIFIAGAKFVDEKVLAGVAILTGAILALTAADLIAGIASFLSGGTSFSTLGTELSNFMINAQPFIMYANQIKPECLQGIKNLAEAILILTGANLIEGITRFFGGESSLATFGSQLGQLGTDLNSFATNLGTFTEDQVKTVSCASKAIKSLAEAASAVPNTGGLWQAIVGESGLATFSSQLPGLGTNLAAFIHNLTANGVFDDSVLTTVETAGKAIKALAEAAKEIPNTGGLWQAIVGESGLATLSSQLPGLGTNLAAFIHNLTANGAFDEAACDTVKTAGAALTALAEASKSMPKEGGWMQKIFGGSGFTELTNQLPSLGTAVKDFATNVKGMTGGDKEAVVAAIQIISLIATLAQFNITNVAEGLNLFGTRLYDLGTDIGDFIKAVHGIGTNVIDNVIKKVEKLKEMCETISTADISKLSMFGEDLKKLGSDCIDGFIQAFTGEDPVNSVKKGVNALCDAVTTAIGEKKGDIGDAARMASEDAVEELGSETIISSASSAGKDLVNGFASGITVNSFKAKAAAKAMAEAAIAAAKEKLKINSPSKIFAAIGGGVPEGFAMGIDKLNYLSTGSVNTMADGAISGVKNAIARITDYMNSDIDSQPTIRPVLDLSEVTAGAGTIGGLFNNPSVGVMANVNSISSMMNRNQNGGNDDVVSAIDKLRKDLSNIGGTSNYIDGINVGDDTNVNEAVKTLVRAAKMGRRS